MEDYSGFALRLRQAMGNENQTEFARKCDIPEATMRTYLKRRIPDAEVALRMARAAGVRLEWLVSGDGPATTTSNPAAQGMFDREVVPGDFSLIPRLAVQASAGSGRIYVGEDPLEYLAFQSHWLRARGINPTAARILTARGDSMEETIRDGDVLLIDTSIDSFKDNAIYVVVYGEMVLVKRVHGRLNGSLQLLSDNPHYPPEEVAAGEVDQLNIAGRVMWFGRTI